MSDQAPWLDCRFAPEQIFLHYQFILNFKAISKVEANPSLNIFLNFVFL